MWVMTILAEASTGFGTPSQYGTVIGGAVAVSGAAWAVVRFLFNRIEKSHQEHLDHFNEAIKREQERADRAERRADQYEAELKGNVKVWFEQVSPAMAATARAIDMITEQIRRGNFQ